MRRNLYLALLLFGPLAGCGPGAEEAGPPPAPQVQTSTPGSAAASSQSTDDRGDRPEAPGGVRLSCFLAVDGQVHVDRTCLVFPFGDGGYTLNAWSDGKPAQSHFAVVTVNGDGAALATWNADPDDSRAGDPLGTVNLIDGCWINDRARICAKPH